jgi:hypothetical protein
MLTIMDCPTSTPLVLAKDALATAGIGPPMGLRRFGYEIRL